MVPVLSVSLSMVTVVERLPACPKPLMVLVQAGPGVGAGDGAAAQPSVVKGKLLGLSAFRTSSKPASPPASAA